MFAHLTERGLELEPVGHTERFALRAYMKENPTSVKIYVLGDVEDKAKPIDEKKDTAVVETPKKNEREEVIEELTALGVTFDRKQGLSYLKKLLAKSKAPKAEEIDMTGAEDVAPKETAAPTRETEVVDDIFGDDTKTDTKVVTKDEFRDAVKNYAAKNGTEKAKEFLQKLGNYTAVSQVPEGRYAEAMGMLK